MKKLALALILLSTPTLAETCKAPKVARVILFVSSAGEISCPLVGLCYIMPAGPSKSYNRPYMGLICFSPQEETEAIARGQSRD